MMQETPDLLTTRRTLLTRLRDAGDQSGWQDFFDTYWALLYRVALKSGLTESEAQDAVQETIITVAQQMPEFRYQPERCSFKGWLLLLTRQRIAHQFRKRNKPGADASRVRAAALGISTYQANAGEGPATVDQLPDSGSTSVEAIWDEEWQQHLLTTATAEVKRQVSDRQFQIFDLYVLQHWPVAEVARTLRVSVPQVYLAKHRIGRLLKKQIQRLQHTDSQICLKPV